MRRYMIRALAGLVAAAAVAFPVAATGRAPGHRPVAATVRLLAGIRPGFGVCLGLCIALLLLARGLLGGRWLAGQLLLLTVLAGLVLPVLVDADAAGPPARRLARSATGLVVLAALLAMRPELTVRPHPRRLRTAAQLAAAGVGAALLHAGWLFGITGDSPTRSARLALSPGGTGGLLVLVAAGCAVAALAVALAAAPPPPPGDTAERACVAALTNHPEADSLAPFATRTDKAYVFSPDFRAAIGYRVVWGVALVGGDPVGAPDAADAAMAAFLRTCAQHGWRPAVLGAGARTAARWSGHTLGRRVPIGDEAIIDVGRFSLASRRMRNVRQAVQRTRNANLTVHIGPLTAAAAAGLRPVLRDWLHGHPERGFAMNLDRLLEPRPEHLLAIAYDPAGTPQAFARFASCAAGRVLTLDVAPRRDGAPNGVVERLIVDVVEYGRSRGVTEVSLNFAGLRSLYTGNGPVTRAAAALTHLLDGWVQLYPLYRFTAKFHPEWRPRWVLMRSWWHLPSVGAAALRAEFGRSRPDTGTVAGEVAHQPAAA